MKRLVEEVSGDGLEKLLGERVQVWCINYIYCGKLVGVNEHDIVLEDAEVVYQAGELKNDGWDASERIAEELFVRTASIESYCVKP